MELSVEQIFAADHATVSRYMADHPECIEPAVHDYLLSHAASARDALKTCLWILCGGASENPPCVLAQPTSAAFEPPPPIAVSTP